MEPRCGVRVGGEKMDRCRPRVKTSCDAMQPRGVVAVRNSPVSKLHPPMPKPRKLAFGRRPNKPWSCSGIRWRACRGEMSFDGPSTRDTTLGRPTMVAASAQRVCWPQRFVSRHRKRGRGSILDPRAAGRRRGYSVLCVGCGFSPPVRSRNL
jgi:hypothetical protein